MRRERSAAGQSFLVEEAAENLAARLGAVNRRFRHGLDLTTRSQSFAMIAPFAEAWTRTALTSRDSSITIADEEALPFAPESFDLVVSVLSLHAVNDLPGALAQIRRVLKPDGLLLAALFGGSTLGELRESFAAGEAELSGGVSPRVAPFADVRDLGGLLQRAGFALPVSDSEKRDIRYRSIDTLFGDLRALGETNALAQRSQKFLRRDVLAASIAHYSAHHSDSDAHLRATFEMIYLTAWAPDESQPKPLRPGSAKSRLADALGTHEESAGERAEPEPD